MKLDSPNTTFTLSPDKTWHLLLHVCCAPCSGGIMEFLASAGWKFTIFFYNPNIYPFEEYQHRKLEVVQFAGKLKIDFLDADYNPDEWSSFIAGYENEPERGKRCEKCFRKRLGMAAEYAHNHGFTHLATTLGISRWKDMEQVNKCGRESSANYPGLIYLDQNWRKSGGVERMEYVSKRENFYRQKYCGCIYSIGAR